MKRQVVTCDLCEKPITGGAVLIGAPMTQGARWVQLELKAHHWRHFVEGFDIEDICVDCLAGAVCRAAKAIQEQEGR